MDILSIIEHKRDKKELSKEEIEYFIKGYTEGSVTDYQAAALIMSIYLNGMTKKETSDLTNAMAHSGEILDLSDISDVIIDKHSTGGVGDKITIILMPIVASLGVPVAKMSGRGLGFTGGTADKLEAIPGYRVDIPIDEFKSNVRNIGISLITSSMNLAPADKKIYALRDTISCVDNIPLIASSIMSKKIASGANKIVIDLTCGSGAFMKNKKDAIKLAKTMIDIGKDSNLEVVSVLTSMDEPVGYAVGNQLEIVEAIKALKGDMPEDVKEIVYALGIEILLLSNITNTIYVAKELIDEAIESGAAFNKFKELVSNQGGDVTYLDDESKFNVAEYVVPVTLEKEGYLSEINTEEIGKVASYLGAGRETKDDVIDMQAGLVFAKKLGDLVKEDEPICYIHTNDKEKIEEAKTRILDACKISNINLRKPKTVIKVVK